MPAQTRHSLLYQTHDLGIAVFLFTVGHNLAETKLLGPRRLSFNFTRREDTDSLVARYLAGQAEAPARRLFENYRALRALTYERTGNVR